MAAFLGSSWASRPRGILSMDCFFHGLNLWDQYRYFWSSHMENVGDLILDDVDFCWTSRWCSIFAGGQLGELCWIETWSMIPKNIPKTAMQPLWNLWMSVKHFCFAVLCIEIFRGYDLCSTFTSPWSWVCGELDWPSAEMFVIPLMSDEFYWKPNVWNQTKSWRFPSKLGCNNLGVHGIFAYGCFQK